MPRSSPAEPLAADARWGPFTVVRSLRTTPFAAAYEARAEGGERVHLKIYDALRPGTSEGQVFERVQRALVPRLRGAGPGVGAIRTFGVIDDRFVKSSDWSDGRPLMQCYGELSPARGLVLARGLSRTVAALHRLAIGHRDLAPTNLLLDAQGLVVVDFDGAAVAGEPGHPLSSPPYAAPEHHAVGVARDPRAGDVFTMGVVIYELVTGWFPWAKEQLYDGGEFCPSRFTAAVGRGDLPLDRDLPGGPPALASVLVRCLQLKPASRPSAEEVEAVLSEIEIDATTGR